jgi:hypothetical protein
MDVNTVKSQYDQTQYLADAIKTVDTDLLKTQGLQDINLLKSQYQQTTDILASQERNGIAAESRINRLGQQIIDNVNDKAATGISAIERNGKDNLVTTERVAGKLDESIYRSTSQLDNNLFRTASQTDNNIYRSASNTDSNIFRTSAQTDTAVYRMGSEIGNQLSSSQAQQTALIQDLASNQALQTQKTTNELLAVLKDNNDLNATRMTMLGKEILVAKTDIMSQSANQYAVLLKQASDNTAAIQIEALKNKGELSKQLAFEYSSLKDKIANTETTLKDVMRTQESDRLRDALRSTENKSLYFELKDRHHHHRRRHH